MEKSPLSHFSIAFLVSVSIIIMLEPMISGSYNLVAQEEVNQQQLQPLSIYDIFNKVEDSVVQITTSVPPSTIPNPDRQQENRTALGSGFVYDNNGHIVTNNHVVADARIVDIIFIDENFTQAELAPPLTLGNSSELKVGDQVVAIGNPFGLEGSITTGIVSQTGRLLPLEETGFSAPNAIQTDALINPGNSGGPLLNMKAEIIGVNTAGIFPGNIGFAVPSNAVKRIVPILIETGNYTHPWLGMTGGPVTSDVAQREGLERNFKGIIVDTIVKNSPADKAGINGSITNQYGERLGGDIITAVDGNPVVRMEDLISYLETEKSVNQNMTLTVYKDGKTIDKQITIGQRPSPVPFLTRAPQPSP
jgi:S1-C subfamily serine protease